jgi:RND family efflux transporter MFP subunit
VTRRTVLLTAIAFATIAPYSAGETITLDGAALSRAGILVRPVLERPFGDQLRVFGDVVRAPGTTMTVKTPLHGRVLELHAVPGQSVSKGDPLLRLHSHELHALEGEVLRRREELLLAQSRLAAGEHLYGLEGISKIELDHRAQQAHAEQIGFEQAMHELEDVGYTEQDVEQLLERGTPDGRLMLRSPTNGVVLELTVQEYEWTEPFQPMMTIGDPGRLELRIRVQPVDSTGIASGDRIDFVPVGHSELSGSARVLVRIPTVDPVTRTVAVRAAIESSDGPLYPGLFVEGVLVRGESKPCPSVPESAVTRIGDHDYVFVQGTPGTFEARAVQLGKFNGTRYEVVEGVETGEEVVVEGAFFLKSALIQGGGD